MEPNLYFPQSGAEGERRREKRVVVDYGDHVEEMGEKKGCDSRRGLEAL